MAEKFNPNSFAPFLETIKRSESGSSPATPQPIVLLQKLAGAPEARMESANLLSASDLPVETFAVALRQLESAGLVLTRMINGREWITLTPAGEQVASVKT